MTVDPTLDPAGLERLLDVTGGDVAFVDELVDTFLEDAVLQVDTLRKAAAAGDAAEMMRPAHSLKSNSDNVGAVALANLCRAVEAEARAGSVSDPTGRAAAIADEFEAVRAGLLAVREAR